MNIIGFEELYSFRERKNKGNLEDFFTELIGLICELSDSFKEIYLNTFLSLNVNSEEIIITTQETRPSLDDEKNYDRPDLFIFLNKQNYGNNQPYVICEHKIDSKTKKSQLESYKKTFDQVKTIYFITPKRPYYSKKIDNKIKHLFWEDLFDIINSEFFNNDFHNIEIINNLSTEKKLIYKLLSFMDWQNINGLNKTIFLHNYKSFRNFVSEIKKSTKIHKSISKNLKSNYDLKGQISELMTFITEDTIKGTKGRFTYGIFMDEFDKIISYKWDNDIKIDDGTNPIKINHNFSMNEDEIIKANQVLNDLYKLFFILLIDISNELKNIKIQENSIKVNYKSESHLYIEYKINDEENYFDLLLKEDKIIIDYDKGKIFQMNNFDFEILYNKLKEFICNEFSCP
jgi:hypothetical protein